MNRRSFLRLLGLLCLGSGNIACGRTAEMEANSRLRRRTIVIGAGMAGLAAANALLRVGHEVVVLEARDRIGGRIWTSTQWPEAPLDLGATWIHGTKGNPLTALANTIQATRVATNYDRSIVYGANGSQLTEAEERQLYRIREQVYAALQQAQDQETDQSIFAPVQKLATSTATAQLVNFVLSSDFEHEYAGSATVLSAHWYDDSDIFAGDDVLFPQGFSVITSYLAQGITIKTSQVVTEIHWQESEVRVITQDARYIADSVIITLPLGVLKSNTVVFVPALPAEKQHAIESLGMGVLNKCYLRFEEAFWSDDVDWLEYISPSHGEWVEWVSFLRVAQKPILLGFNAADYGREIEDYTDAQIVEGAMQVLRTIFGSRIPDPLDYQITRWMRDPFARGSYSFNALGSTPALRDVLAQPLGNRLFFAGEATSREHFGTAHGAYLSGLRAAQEVESG